MQIKVRSQKYVTIHPQVHPVSLRSLHSAAASLAAKPVSMAGALQRRLVGPVWQGGKKITDLWLGDESDPEGGQPEDMRRMCVFVSVTCLFATALAVFVLFL